MIIFRPASTRGLAKNDWIQSRRTFSNNDYWNPKYMNWLDLKVINDDILEPGHMVPKHEHKNYDIFGYLVEGKLEHWDTCGSLNTAEPGQIQHMWCGRSIWHTEKCVSTIPARYLQIWFTARRNLNTSPYYEVYEKDINFALITASKNSDLKFSGGILSVPKTTNNSYIYVINGSCSVAGQILNEGDGGQITSECDIIPIDSPHIILVEV